jgi:uncharacterized protein
MVIMPHPTAFCENLDNNPLLATKGEAMLIEFNVGNFRSFKDRTTFSMVAASLSSQDKELDEHNVIIVDKELSLLKSAAIYGANGSGKSNLAAAFRFMQRLILNSSKETQVGEPIKVENFKLGEETASKPSFFEIIFMLGTTKYRYGFEVDADEVHAEWLFHVPSTKEAKLFERKQGAITSSKSFKEAKGLGDKTRDNALFLSVLAQFNGKVAKSISSWFQRSLNIISGLSDRGYRSYTLRCLKEKQYSEEILHFIKELDLGFDDIAVEMPTTDSGEEEEDNTQDVLEDVAKPLRSTLARALLERVGAVKTLHRVFDKQGKPASMAQFDIDSNESEGTKKLIFLAGPLMDTLKHGKVLFIDEFDARLHPLITHEIIRLFNSRLTNPHNSQLIFVTHDTNLLSKKLFRRDQIWFAEKDRVGATHLHSLVEYKVRNDASFEKNYIKGKYGAIPFIGDLSQVFGEKNGK